MCPTSASTTKPAVISVIERMRGPAHGGNDASGRRGHSLAMRRDFAPVSGRAAHRIASYQADPEQVGRVLLLYSGGLDTSVMLHWIQERYGAEIVTLTVDLGQPGEDWEVVVAKARDLGALDTMVVDAREEFAATTCCRRSRPTRSTGRLPAVHGARPPLDRQARRRARAAAPAATRSPTAAPARETTRCGSRRRWRRSTPSWGDRAGARVADGA